MASPTAPELEKINPSDKQIQIISENNKNNNVCKEKSPFKKQTFVSFGVFMLNLGVGGTAGISAILIPQLKEEARHRSHGRHGVSPEMASWVASISSLALLFGNIISGYIMERFGRQRALLALSTCFTAGWIVICASQNNMGLILFGRFITGFCQGWLGPLGPVFIAEVTSPIYRGFFLAALSLGITLGVFLSHLMGTFWNWRTTALLCGLFPFIGGVTLYYAPESPLWLAARKRIDESVISYQWYRGRGLDTKVEFDKMIAEQTNKDKTMGKIETLKANIQKPEFWKPLSIMMVFFFMTQLSGINVICAYTTDIVKELFGKDHHKRKENDAKTYAAMLSIDVLRCLSLLAACILLRVCGRRPMAIVSGAGTAISLLGLASYLYFVEDTSPYISLSLMAFYIIISHLGIGPLPWNMVGELFASETKGVGSGLSVMMTSVAFFGVVKTAPAMFDSLGHHGTYLIYGISTLLGTIFLFFCLPETKDKTLLQIEEHFRYGKKKRVQSEWNGTKHLDSV